MKKYVGLSGMLDKHNNLRTPLKLIGAKSKVRHLLYPLMPDHEMYVEPFMGSGSVLIGKPPVPLNGEDDSDRDISINMEIMSDVNSYAVNFFRVVQNSPLSFWAMLQEELELLQLKGKSRFERLKGLVIERKHLRIPCAVYFYLVTKACMNGIWRLNRAGECNSSYCGQTHGRGWLTYEWLMAVHQRLQGVTVEHGSCDDLLQGFRFTDDRLFVFLDPPYFDCETTYNGIKFREADFYSLRRRLQSAKYNWMMTINDHPFIRNLFPDKRMIEWDVNYSCSQTAAGRGPKPELIITNYEVDKQCLKNFRNSLISGKNPDTGKSTKSAQLAD